MIGWGGSTFNPKLSDWNAAGALSYEIGLPRSGQWREVFNSDVYDHWVNPSVAGNGGGVQADGGPLHGFDHSVRVVIPANALIVLIPA